MTPFKSSLACAFILALAASAHAAGGSTGADVLDARLGARPVGMGGAYSALGDDLAVTLYNPAGLVELKGPELSFLHFAAIAEISYENFAYAQPLSFGTMGLNLLVRNQPDINNPLAQDNPVSAYDVAVTLSYAQRLAYFLDQLPENLRNLSIGVNLKYLRSHLGKYDADVFAGDLGLRYPWDETTTLAASVTNVGTPIRFISVSDPLPTAFIGGLARHFELSKGNLFNAAVDVEYPTLGDLQLHLGAEDWLGHSLALRVGYLLEAGDSLGGLTGGLTIRMDQETLRFSFDYAFQPVYYAGFNSFEPQHLFSMSLGF